MHAIGLQEYYTSGFLSLQAAIDAYTLGLSAQLESSLDVHPAGELGIAGLADASSDLYTEWGVVFPTAEYEHNEFYDAGTLSSAEFVLKSVRNDSGVVRMYAC